MSCGEDADGVDPRIPLFIHEEDDIIPSSSTHPNPDDQSMIEEMTITDPYSLDSPLLPKHSKSRPNRGKFRRRAFHPLIIQIFLLFMGFSIGDALKCYCTDDHCVPFGACEGPACLVGILRDSNQVIRTCGTRPIGCHKGDVLSQYYGEDDEKWTDLCACDQPFCNTFSYLRSHTRKETGVPSEDTPLIFHRMDRPDDMNYQVPGADAPISSRSSMLTTLLVVVPLTVGGAAIAVVAFNYYCHLC